MNEQSRTLLVLWQHQESRQFVPVGRLTVDSSDAGQLFELVYVRGCQHAQKLGFQPFVAFPRTDRVYRSSALFPFFRNRVLQRSRPDYDAHVRTLGLAPPFDAVDVLGRSEGRRETDHIEVVPAPRRDPATGFYDVHFWVRDVRHLPGAENAIATLAPGHLLQCAADPTNRANPRALLLRTQAGRPVGYLPDYLVEDAHALLEQQPQALTIRVERVNLPPTPPQRRVLCRLQAPWPAGFEPLGTDELQPLGAAPDTPSSAAA